MMYTILKLALGGVIFRLGIVVLTHGGLVSLTNVRMYVSLVLMVAGLMCVVWTLVAEGADLFASLFKV